MGAFPCTARLPVFDGNNQKGPSCHSCHGNGNCEERNADAERVAEGALCGVSIGTQLVHSQHEKGNENCNCAQPRHSPQCNICKVVNCPLEKRQAFPHKLLESIAFAANVNATADAAIAFASDVGVAAFGFPLVCLCAAAGIAGKEDGQVE